MAITRTINKYEIVSALDGNFKFAASFKTLLINAITDSTFCEKDDVKFFMDILYEIYNTLDSLHIRIIAKPSWIKNVNIKLNSDKNNNSCSI